MAYTPSLNGGRLNASIAGNTTGLSSAAAVSTGTVVFAGGTNVTLSQSTGIGGATISFNAAGGGGVQSLSMYGVGNTTQSSAATLDARSVSLNGLGALSVGYSGSSVMLSAPPVSTLSGAGAVTISAAGSNITIGAPAFSAGMSNIGNTSGTTGLVTNQVVFAGGNNITLSQSTGVSGNTISVAGPPLYSGGISTLGNTAGATGFATNQLLLVGGSNITLSQSTGAGGNTVSIIGAAGGTGGGGGATGIALYDGVNSISSGTASIQAVGPLTASINNQTLSLAVPSLTTLTGAGGISISSNGSTITISGQPNPTISRWEDPTIQFASMATIPQGSLSIKHAFVPFYVSGTAAKIGGSLGLATSTAAQVGSISMSLWMGIYTMNGETLSLATSGSANNSFTFQGASSASTNYGTITGMRELTVPMNINMTPGEYWVGAVMSTSTSGGLNGTYTIWGNTQQITASTPLLAPIGATSLSAYGFLPGQGLYKTTVANMPASIALSSINNTAGTNVMRANFYNAFYNTSFT